MEDKKENYEKKVSKKGNLRKIILLGDKSVGKTSIFSMIFTHLYPTETLRFESTKSISLNQIIFSGGEMIEFDECGFEDTKNKDSNQYILKKNIFQDVSTFIFAINAEAKNNWGASP